MDTTKSKRKPRNRLTRYFFIDGELCKRIKISARKDTIEVYNYNRRRVTVYVYSYVRKNYRPAYTKEQVAELLMRKKRTITAKLERKEFMPTGAAHRPDDPTFKTTRYWFSEEDILALHDIFVNAHWGRERNDGEVVPKEIPTRAEVVAKMRDNITLYVQNEEGQFVRLYKEVSDWK